MSVAATWRLVFLVLVAICEIATAETHCLPTEKVIFNCELAKGRKIASVCASENLTATNGYLQYRFGKVGKLELIYPPTKVGAQQRFYWTQLHPYQSFINELSFKSGKYLYTLATYGISEELNDIPGGADFGQIEITKLPGNGQPTVLKCGSYSQDGMWELGGIVKDAEDLIVH